ncbi:sensor histidine kinase [Clostridium grantii]|uniref:histidine kinase n=1 Tax=Clostridium grantii DSM 8605 TaxID=1121316 RepID=A0A1M5S552_9CLOT|nr:HAMP domain-containing sensor histidine kinase [Clostridium grantii]SHH33616.1 His Kinase A (phospho-acceptor) domain-containing protein [Clostridium grantii DSM 8605]
MNSIKKKLFLQIGSLIVFLVILLLLANTLLLESYYTYKQKNKLVDYYATINSMDSTDYDDNLLDFLAIESASNVDILVMGSTGDVLYASNSFLADKRLLDELMNLMSINMTNFAPVTQTPINIHPAPSPKNQITKSEKIDDKTSFVWASDPLLSNTNLLLFGTLDNGNLIELRLPIAAIKTNIKVSNDFLLIIGLIVFAISMIFAYVVSNYFTKPITAMNDVTKRLKHLDFDTSCEVISNDEIGQLADSINKMSLALSSTITSLNFKNTQLEKEIQEKNRLDEKRRTLLNNVSHELKTPLSLMQGYAEGLKLNVIKNKEKSDFYCDVIIDESIKMNRLVESLLNIDQMEFGDNILHKSTFEINEFIVQTLDKYNKIFQDKSILFTINTIAPIEVIGDAFMIERVFENYITNAINYVDENLEISVRLFKLNNTIKVEVFNTCEIIDEKDLDKIWDSFYKLDKARSREKGGHGLGLSIVKAIQEAHGNSYGAKNVPTGICFWFEIDINRT